MRANAVLRVLFSSAVVASFCWLAAGCASQDAAEQPGNNDGETTVLSGQPAGLPAPAALRGISGLTETLVQGKFTLLRSSGAVDNGTALELAAGSSMEWGLYGFDPEGNAPDSVSVSLDVTPGDSAWIGLADYDRGVWEWHGPLSAGKTLAVDEARYLSPGGLLYCTVAASAGDSATVSALSIRTINPQNENPTAAFSPSTDTGTAPLSVDLDASASSDSDGQLVEYAWDWDGDGLYDGFSDQPLASHVFTQPGIYDVALRVSDEQFGRDTASISINVGVAGNISPSASFTTTPPAAECIVGQPVSFDAALSSDPDGSLVRYDWDFDGNGTWDAYDSGAQVEHIYMEGAFLAPKLRVTDDRGAQDITSVNIEVSSSGASAAFTPSISSGPVPLDVHFDASASSVSDGYIAEYAWDWDGDGAYEEVSPNNQVSHTFTTPGQWNVALRITGSAGGSDTTWATVSAVMLPTVVGSADGTSIGLSMEVVAGTPAWAYYNAADSALYFRRAGNEAGTELNDTVVVDNSADVGQYASLAIVNGNPAIAYIDKTNTQLMFCRASGALGGAWNAPVMVDTNADPYTVSLAIVNGLPGIAYRKSGDVTFVQATNVNGGAWGAPANIHTAATTADICLAVVNGNPAVSFWDVPPGKLYYARATDVDGAAWGGVVTLDTGVHQLGACLRVVGGVPAVCYCIGSSRELRLARAANADGTAWNAPVTLDAETNSGIYPWLATIETVPVISYFRNGMLAIIRANDPAGGSWNDPVIINPDADAFFSQCREVNGRLTVSTFQSTGELNYFWGL